MQSLKFIIPALAALLLAGCASTRTITVDLDHPAKTAAGSAAEDASAAREIPDDLRESHPDPATETDAPDRQLRDAHRYERDFLRLCNAMVQGPAPAATSLEKQWLKSQRHVPVAAPAVDCVFYRHQQASAVFFKPSGDNDFYFKYEVLPQLGPRRRVAKNPVAHSRDKHLRQTIAITGTYHQLVQAHPEFTYCVDTRDGCVPRTVKRRATIAFTRDQRQVETLYLLDELVAGDAHGSGQVLRRVAVYSETAQEYLTTVTTGEDRAQVREAMAYAMPTEIIYMRDGRETLRLDETALEAVRRAMMALPAQF